MRSISSAPTKGSTAAATYDRLSLKLGQSYSLRTMSVLIPDDILQATKMTEEELRLEIAIMLYKQEKISSGKVRAWTGLTVIEFQHELAKRGLSINYDVEDFQSDIKTLRLIGLL
jgi:predicted HTH domain antitoxin